MSENGDNFIASVLRTLYRKADGSFSILGAIGNATALSFVGLFVSSKFDSGNSTPIKEALVNGSVANNLLSQGFVDLPKASIFELLNHKKNIDKSGVEGSIYFLSAAIEKNSGNKVENPFQGAKTAEELIATASKVGATKPNGELSYQAGDIVFGANANDKVQSHVIESVKEVNGKLVAEVSFTSGRPGKKPDVNQRVEHTVSVKDGVTVFTSASGSTIVQQGATVKTEKYLEKVAPEYYSTEKAKLGGNKTAAITPSETLSDISQLPLEGIKKADVAAVVSRPTDTPSELNDRLIPLNKGRSA